MDELSGIIKELRDIESRFVISLHAKVVDAQVAVVIGPGQHIVPFSLRCVENVRHSQLLQVWSLQRRFPANLVSNSHQQLSLLHSFHNYSLIPDVHVGPNQVEVCVCSPRSTPEQLLQV